MKEYKLFIQPTELRKLTDDIWSEEHVEGTIITNKKKYKIDFGLRGHQIREHRKKSYHIIFKKPWLNEQAHEIHLNAEFMDPSLIRNKLSMDFFNRIGVLAPQGEHVLLYINGLFKGVYLQLESFDQYYLNKKHLPPGPLFYATNDDANFSLLTAEGHPKTSLLDGYTRKYGTESDDDGLADFLIKINTLPDDEFKKEIEKLLNIDHYLRWLAGAVCTQNFDGFDHNYALYQNRATKQFEISPWDYDGTWGRDIKGQPLENDYVPIEGYNTLTARILHIDSFKKQYKKVLSSILQHEFTVEFQLPIVESFLKELTPFIKQDPFIKENKYQFSEEAHFIKNFIQNRNSYLKQSLKSLD